MNWRYRRRYEIPCFKKRRAGKGQGGQVLNIRLLHLSPSKLPRKQYYRLSDRTDRQQDGLNPVFFYPKSYPQPYYRSGENGFERPEKPINTGLDVFITYAILITGSRKHPT